MDRENDYIVNLQSHDAEGRVVVTPLYFLANSVRGTIQIQRGTEKPIMINKADLFGVFEWLKTQDCI